MLFEKTFDELLGEAIAELTTNTAITKPSPGTKARALLEILSRKLNDAYKTFDLNLARAFVQGANGRFLDYIAELVGLERIGLGAGSASADAKTVRFFVETGTFGDINSGSSILLPANTIISSDSESGVRYRLTNSFSLPSGSSELYVSVQAILPGSVSNVGAGFLTFHDFIGYTDAANDSLKVTNDQGIFNGRDLESDTNFRFRITRQVTAAESANLTAIRLAALSVPGVADIVFIPYARGIGTYDILIKAITPTVSDSLIASVQAAIEEVTAQGIVGRADGPIEVGISFAITVTYTKQLPERDRSEIESKIRNGLVNYINNLDIGEDFIINEAVQRVMEVDDRIMDIGVPTKPFDEILIYKPTRLQDGKITNTLLKNYLTENNERLIIEPSVATPISISTAI